MVTVFIPENKRRFNKKDLCRGFWRNDSGKVYYDYIKPYQYGMRIDGLLYQETFKRYLDNLRIGLKQEAIFYKVDNQAFIYDGVKTIKLENRIALEVGFNRANLKGLIKRFLRDYNGVTVYRETSGYIIEAFY